MSVVSLKKIFAGEHAFIKVSRKEGAVNTLFAFSHVGYPEGKFALSGELADIDANVVFVNTTDNSWYQSGAGTEIPTINQLRDVLLQIKTELPSQKTYTVGMSMGGYAAVLFGGLLYADAVLAFTPEINIGLNHGRSWKLNGLKVYDEEYKTLAGIIDRSTSTVFNLVYGIYDLTDLALLWPISEKLQAAGNVNFLPCSDGHKVPLSVGVRNLVRAMLDHRRLQGADLGTFYAPGETFDKTDLLHLRDAVQLHEAGQHPEFRKLLQDHLPDRPWRSYFLAESFRAENNNADAIPSYYRAIAQDGRYAMPYFWLCEALEAEGRYYEAAFAWSRLLQLAPNNIQFNRRCGMNLLRLKIYDGAEKMFRNILRINPEDVAAREQLDALQKT